MALPTKALIQTIRREWAIDGLHRNVIARRHRLRRGAILIICTVGRPVCPSATNARDAKLKALCKTIAWEDAVVARLQLLVAAGVHLPSYGTRSSKLSAEHVSEIRDLYAAGYAQPELARRFGIDQSCVSKIVRGELYRHSLLARALQLRMAATEGIDGDDADADGPSAQLQVALWPSGAPMHR